MLAWNYYLESRNGEIYYESYEGQSSIEKQEDVWALKSTFSNETYFLMNVTNNEKSYPVGVFDAFYKDLNG